MRGSGTKIIVTTSWDDGHPLDIRLAELLSSYGVKGTFYLPVNYSAFPLMTTGQMRALRGMGMEIGSHTLTHPIMTKITEKDALQELRQSKQVLEDILGERIDSFCYPSGKFNTRTRRLVSAAGYQLARTTLAFRTETAFDSTCMPVSFQFLPHPKAIHIRHALKEGNLRGLLNWMTVCGMEIQLLRLSELMWEHILAHGGIFHIWGHSWELDRYGLWDVLKKVLERVARRKEVSYLTNRGVLEVIRG